MIKDVIAILGNSLIQFWVDILSKSGLEILKSGGEW